MHASTRATLVRSVTLQLSKSISILYRGYGLSVLGAQPVYALYFGAYEAAKLKARAGIGCQPGPWDAAFHAESDRR